MDPIVESFRKRLAAAHAGMKQAVEGATPDELLWTPAEIVYPGGRTSETVWNSLAMLTRHTCGAGKTFAAAAAGRDARFSAAMSNEPATAEELVAVIDDADAYVAGALEEIDGARLHEPGYTTRSGMQLTKLDTLLFLVAHTQEHRGQMALLRKMLRERGSA